MKLINPILITLNNVPHIKADNLEPVEIDITSYHLFMNAATYLVNGNEKHNNLSERRDNALIEGIPLPQELSDRIEVREERILLAKSGGYREGLMIEPATFIDGKPYKVTYKAFLLLVKEDNFPNIASALRKGINPMYTIEEIEKAIDEMLLPMSFKERLKIAVINNLKK